MARYSLRLGLWTACSCALALACSDDETSSKGGTGGYVGTGGYSTGGAAFGGAGGLVSPGAGGSFTGAGGFSSSGGAPGAGGSSGAPVGSGGTLPDGGDGSVPDAGDGALEGAASDASDDGRNDGSVEGAPGAGGQPADDGSVPDAASGGAGGAATEGGPPVCGNGVPERGEACDTAVDSASCDSDCTAPRCDDRHVNSAAGEECDDGNRVPNDGCDVVCQLENTCGAPIVVALTDDQGTLRGSSQGDTTDSANRVIVGACDGASAGGGPDALFSFTLERTRSVTLTVSAGFDALVRTYTQPCVRGAPLAETGGDACANATVGAGSETMSFQELTKGTYYVVVDGATSGDNGTFSLDVAATCNGVDELRLVELGIGSTDYVVLRNMSDCPAPIGGVKVLFDDATNQDLTVTLPSRTLEPGEQLRIQENLGGTVPGAIDAGGSIPFQYDRGGTVRLCKSDCTRAGDILDALSFADGDPVPPEPPPGLPASVSFAFPVSGISGANQNTKSWVRVGTSGKNPGFTGADWCTGTPNVPFGLRLREVFIGDPDYVAIENHADCPVLISPFQVRFETGGITSGIDSALDDRRLARGARVYLSEPPIQSNDVSTGTAVPNAAGLSGTVRLCRGTCATRGTTVDAVAWDGSSTVFPPLPIALVFSPAGLAPLGNASTSSYLRAALSGNSPLFVAADWTTGSKSR